MCLFRTLEEGSLDPTLHLTGFLQSLLWMSHLKQHNKTCGPKKHHFKHPKGDFVLWKKQGTCFCKAPVSHFYTPKDIDPTLCGESNIFSLPTSLPKLSQFSKIFCLLFQPLPFPLNLTITATTRQTTVGDQLLSLLTWKEGTVSWRDMWTLWRVKRPWF